jgi:hypothetical protein
MNFLQMADSIIIVSLHLVTPFISMALPKEQCTRPGNTKVGSITVPLTSGLTGLKSVVWQP